MSISDIPPHSPLRSSRRPTTSVTNCHSVQEPPKITSGIHRCRWIDRLSAESLSVFVGRQTVGAPISTSSHLFRHNTNSPGKGTCPFRMKNPHEFIEHLTLCEKRRAEEPRSLWTADTHRGSFRPLLNVKNLTPRARNVTDVMPPVRPGAFLVSGKG